MRKNLKCGAGPETLSVVCYTDYRMNGIFELHKGHDTGPAFYGIFIGPVELNLRMKSVHTKEGALTRPFTD